MEPEKTKQLSRQRRFQMRNKANGKCKNHAQRDAVDIAMCQECADRHRATQGIKKPYPKRSEWDKVDFSLTNTEVARQMGVTVAAAHVQRKRRGLPYNSRRGRPPEGGAP